MIIAALQEGLPLRAVLYLKKIMQKLSECFGTERSNSAERMKDTELFTMDRKHGTAIIS